MRRFRNPFKHENKSDQAQGYPFRHIVVALDGSAFAELRSAPCPVLLVRPGQASGHR